MMARRCPYCDGKMYVIGTYKYKKSRLLMFNHEYRRRTLECESCGERIATYEIDRKDLVGWKEKLEKAQEKADRADRSMTAVENLAKRYKEKAKLKNDDNQS